MQTFLPDPCYALSAQYLDRQRLGKQRVECLQILRALHGETRGWLNHPAVRMWRGYEQSLVSYTQAVCEEWQRRGYADSVAAKICLFFSDGPRVLPPWLGDPAFHRAHRSNLLRKAPEHYRKFWPDDPADLPYLWPVV